MTPHTNTQRCRIEGLKALSDVKICLCLFFLISFCKNAETGSWQNFTSNSKTQQIRRLQYNVKKRITDEGYVTNTHTQKYDSAKI